jgi:FkbM family methyltransferase
MSQAENSSPGLQRFKAAKVRLVKLLFRFNVLPIWNREVGVWGCRVKASSFDRLVCLYLHRFGLMGVEDRRAFASQIRPGMTVVDVGANQGLYALFFASRVGGDGRVLAFEPDPELFGAMESNCRRNRARNVELFNFALGAKPAEMTLCRSPFNAGDNRLSETVFMDWHNDVPVKMSTLDELVGCLHVDFIKIDVQGWEFEVLKGMKDILRSNPRVRIYFEYWAYGLRKSGADPMEMFSYLEAASFQLHEFRNNAWRPIDDPAEFCRRTNDNSYVNLFAIPRGEAL